MERTQQVGNDSIAAPLSYRFSNEELFEYGVQLKHQTRSALMSACKCSLLAILDDMSVEPAETAVLRIPHWAVAIRQPIRICARKSETR